MEQALANDCPIVQGGTMLLTQGLEQFQLWTDRRPPALEMEKGVFENIEKL